jgi:N-acetylglucosamine-6-sulfatase
LQEDPLESRNLINDPRQATTVKQMNEKLFATLQQTGGMTMPLYRDKGGVNRKRHPGRTKAADFPPEFK